jgi:hypothetical protein
MKDELKSRSEKTPGSGVIALQRIGRGALGSWCIIGPLVLIYAYSEFGLGLLLIFTIPVTVPYAIAIQKWRNQGSPFLRAVGLDTLLSFIYGIVFGVIGGIISALGGPKLPSIVDGISLFLVFWIEEEVRLVKKGQRTWREILR